MNQGLFLKPTMNWDGEDNSFEFVINGWSDSNYAKNEKNWKNISRRISHMFKSGTQKYACLSGTETKLSTGVTCA